MDNTFLNAMKKSTNYIRTENNAVAYRSTLDPLMDLFAMGGSYRTRTDADCILLFKKAFEADEKYALKCLFYLGDCRGGQGERRFFRVCAKWLADTHTAAMKRNLIHVPEYTRWDNMFVFMGTALEKDMLKIVKNQLTKDLVSETPSLLAKWMPSENTSSVETCALATRIRKYLNLSSKQYRKTLSALRKRINVLEKLMSDRRWDEIEFDKIPSKAGIKYRKAFERHDVDRKENNPEVQSYADFAKSKDTKVNAEVLNPVDIAHRAFERMAKSPTEIAMLDKYWLNLKDYYHGREENGIAICDVSGSMWGQPLEAAVSMSAYIAERGKGPFKNHFITFSDNPQLVEFEGINIVDKFIRASKADWGGSTNIEAALDLILKIALKNKLSQDSLPTTLYVFSDMEFNQCMTHGTPSQMRSIWASGNIVHDPETLFETIAKRWATYGYELPRVIFWNLQSRQNNIPAINGKFAYVSGFSMNMVECVLSGKDGLDLVLEKLDSERYTPIH